ncbi:hypothetical protein JCM24511_09571 [Saitozyma sp. JCM 24511]|nr:hypothetical protein JCM24511_09571 [Saitozyma sp. JCM 24511]
MPPRRKLSTSVGGPRLSQASLSVTSDQPPPAKKRGPGLRSASLSTLPAAPSTTLPSDPSPGPSSSFSASIDKIGVTSNVRPKAQASRKKKTSAVTRTQVRAGKGPGRIRPTQPKQEEMWDDHFNDPEAKLIIKSDDGVKFRASGWQLSQCSGFFAGMLTLPQPADTDTQIELLAPAKVIRLVLSMVALPPMLRSWPHGRDQCPTFRDCLEVMDFAAKYEVSGVRQAALHALGGAVYGAAVELFKAASDRNDLDIAAIAIRCLKKEDFASNHRARFKYQRTYTDYDGRSRGYVDSDAIARDFARDVRGRASGGHASSGELRLTPAD